MHMLEVQQPERLRRMAPEHVDLNGGTEPGNLTDNQPSGIDHAPSSTDALPFPAHISGVRARDFRHLRQLTVPSEQPTRLVEVIRSNLEPQADRVPRNGYLEMNVVLVAPFAGS
jgi:hypothetical protein